jgi:hypothetical protein
MFMLKVITLVCLVAMAVAAGEVAVTYVLG